MSDENRDREGRKKLGSWKLQVVEALNADKSLKRNELKCALAIMKHLNKDSGGSHVSQDVIAACAGINRSAAITATKGLVAKEWILRKKVGKRYFTTFNEKKVLDFLDVAKERIECAQSAMHDRSRESWKRQQQKCVEEGANMSHFKGPGSPAAEVSHCGPKKGTIENTRCGPDSQTIENATAVQVCQIQRSKNGKSNGPGFQTETPKKNYLCRTPTNSRLMKASVDDGQDNNKEAETLPKSSPYSLASRGQ